GPAAAEVVADLLAETTGLPVVDDAAGDRTAQRRAERGEFAAGALDEPVAQRALRGGPEGELQQRRRERVDAAPLGPRDDVGDGTAAERPGGGHAVDLVQLGDQLD